jgi:hypothetical protein
MTDDLTTAQRRAMETLAARGGHGYYGMRRDVRSRLESAGLIDHIGWLTDRGGAWCREHGIEVRDPETAAAEEQARRERAEAIRRLSAAIYACRLLPPEQVPPLARAMGWRIQMGKEEARDDEAFLND